MPARRLSYITPVHALVAAKSPRPSLRPITEAVAEFYEVTYPDIIERQRIRRYSLPRHAAMLLAFEMYPDVSVSEIARQFKRNHSTVMWAIRHIRFRMEERLAIKHDSTSYREVIVPLTRREVVRRREKPAAATRWSREAARLPVRAAASVHAWRDRLARSRLLGPNGSARPSAILASWPRRSSL